MQNINEALFHAGVQHQIYLQRYSTQVVREMQDLLNQSELDIIAKLSRADLTEFAQRRLRIMLDDVLKLSNETYKILQERLNNKLTDTAHYESDFNANLIEKLLPVEITLIRPAIETLSALVTSKPMQGRFIADEVKDLDAASVKRIEQAIRIGVIEGETTPDIIRRIRGSKALNYKDGILQRSRDDVERLVRTSITHITARARDELYRANESVVKAWRFDAFGINFPESYWELAQINLSLIEKLGSITFFGFANAKARENGDRSIGAKTYRVTPQLYKDFFVNLENESQLVSGAYSHKVRSDCLKQQSVFSTRCIGFQHSQSICQHHAGRCSQCASF